MDKYHGKTLWITGLSGVGKTTIAKLIVKQLRISGNIPIHLDGDQVRDVICDETCGHDHASRLKNAYRICKMGKLIADQGATVIISTMSLFHEIHDWNRENLPNYMECYITAPSEELISRDPKGIYKQAKKVNEQTVPGINLQFEAPLEPHIHIENPNSSAKELMSRVQRIIDEFKKI